jgi:hypothetical protein
MRVSTFLSITAAIAIFFGLFQMLAPTKLGVMYGVNAELAENLAFTYNLRLLGSALTALGVLAWLIRHSDFAVVRPYLIAMVVCNATGVAISLHRQLVGGTGMGWLNVLLYGALLIGAFYFLSKRETTLTASQPI